MRRNFLAAFAVLLALPLEAQTINPNQIRPGTANGEVLTTVTANQPPSWQQVQSVLIQTNSTPNAWQSTLNFSNTTPAAPAGYMNVLWQNSGGNESAYVAQTSSTSGAQCFLGTAGLVGAFTDSSGIVKQPLCIGNGPTSLQVPTGATQLLLGVDDNKFSDNGGSFVVSASVNGGTATQYTVQSTSEPWDVTANPSYTYGTTGGTAPILGPTGLNPGDTVTITYASGTVSCYAGTKPNVDANGYLTNPPGNADCAGGPTGTYVDPTYGKFPTYYMGAGYSSLPSTSNVLKGNGSGGALASTLLDDGTNPTRAPDGLNTATSGNFQEFTAASGGVTLGQALCVTGTNDGGGRPEVAACTTNSLGAGFAGIAHSTVAAGGTVEVCWTVNCPALFDNSTTQLHEAIVSTTTAGELHDTGSNIATAGQANFSVLSANAGPGTTALIGISDATANNPKGGGGNRGGVSSLNSLTGALSITGDSSITVTPSGSSIALHATGSGGSGVQYNDPSTSYIWYSASIFIVSTTNQVAATAVSCDGTTCTITAPNSYVAGQPIQFNANSAWSPACLNWGIALVSATGLSSTQFEVPEAFTQGSLGCTGAQTGTGGQVQDASYFWPFAAENLPFFKGHGNIFDEGLGGGVTSTDMVNDYASYVHPYTTAVTGKPSYVILLANPNDLAGGTGGNCFTLSQMESNYQALMENAHTDGAQVVMISGPSFYLSENLCTGANNTWNALNQWLRGQGKSSSASSQPSGAYWDRFVDAAQIFTNYSDTNLYLPSYHLNDGGNALAAALTNAAMGVQGSSVQACVTCTLASTPTLQVNGLHMYPGSGLSFQWNITNGHGEGDLVNNNAGVNAVSGIDFYNIPNGGVSGGGYGTPIVQIRGSSDPSIGSDTGIILNKPTSGKSFEIGMFDDGTSDPFIAVNGVKSDKWVSVTGGEAHALVSTGVWGWLLNTNDYEYRTDTGLSKCAAAIVCVGNGTSGDKSGTLEAANFFGPATAPSGACTPNGNFEFTQDGVITRCLAGTWTTFSGGGGGGISDIVVTVSGATQAANSCSTPANVTMTGLTTSMSVTAGYSANPSALTGWGTSGGMVFQIWPSASNTATWQVCNQTAASITYSPITFNVGAR